MRQSPSRMSFRDMSLSEDVWNDIRPRDDHDRNLCKTSLRSKRRMGNAVDN